MGKKQKRGYPIAILIGLDEQRAVLWHLFSTSTKSLITLKFQKKFERLDKNEIYREYERIIDAFRPSIKEGVKNLIVVSSPKSTVQEGFMLHIKKHQPWLIQHEHPNAVAIGQIEGKAIDLHDIDFLRQTPLFQQLLSETTEGSADQIVASLESRLNNTKNPHAVLYGYDEIEVLFATKVPTVSYKPSALVLSSQYWNVNRNRSQIQWLLQIAKNRGVKTITVSSDTESGQRIDQLGGLLCFTEK